MKKKIKVLHVLNLVGGVEICFRQICQNIDESIIETSVVCQKLGNKSKLVTSKGKEITPLVIPIVREINPVLDLFSIIKLIFLIKKIKPDVIHAHSAKGGVLVHCLHGKSRSFRCTDAVCQPGRSESCMPCAVSVFCSSDVSCA